MNPRCSQLHPWISAAVGVRAGAVVLVEVDPQQDPPAAAAATVAAGVAIALGADLALTAAIDTPAKAYLGSDGLVDVYPYALRARIP